MTEMTRKEAAKRGRRGKTRPRMTESQARDFDRMSEASAEQLAAAIEARAEAGIHENCDCQPYEDVFTIGRWNAQGYSVRRGEKALRVSSYAVTEGEDETDGEAKRHLRPVNLVLFCRCQVENHERKGL